MTAGQLQRLTAESSASYPAPALGLKDRLVDLEMHRRAVGRDGAAEFLWPVPPLDYHRARDAIASALVEAVRAASTESTIATSALRLLTHFVLLESLSLYVSHRLVNAFRSHGFSVHAPTRARVLGAVAAGITPLPPKLRTMLAMGPSVPSPWRAPMRLARDFLVQKNIRRRVVKAIDRTSDVVASSIDPLLEYHAGQVPTRIVYRRWHHWFGAPAIGATANHGRLAARIVEAVASAFVANGETLGSASAAGLQQWISESIALVEGHIRSLSGRAPLPDRLWTGSAGLIWNRLLQWAVRDRSGHVTGHDHGSGNGHVEPEIYRTMFEYEMVDTFVTYTDGQALGQRAAFTPRLLVEPHTVTIEGIGGGLPPMVARKRSAYPARPRHIMILSSYYFGDVVTCEGYVPDLPMLDFEARLMAELAARGYAAIYKPHPLITTRAPYDMADRLGGTELNRPSEQVLHHADVIIMLDPLSTAFATTLVSGRPAVLVDFGLAPLTPHARELLSRRAGIVSAQFDRENRIQIEWDALVAAIERAPELDDPGFVEAYYGAI